MKSPRQENSPTNKAALLRRCTRKWSSDTNVFTDLNRTNIVKNTAHTIYHTHQSTAIKILHTPFTTHIKVLQSKYCTHHLPHTSKYCNQNTAHTIYHTHQSTAIKILHTSKTNPFPPPLCKKTKIVVNLPIDDDSSDSNHQNITNGNQGC